VLKVLWNCFGNFLIFRCMDVVKTVKFFLKKWSSLTSVRARQTLFNVWPYQGRRYLTSDGLWQTLNCSGFFLILAQKLTSVLLAPTLDNVGLLKDRRQVTSALFSDVILTSPDTTSVFGQTSKVENLGR